jgi:hypothetical protein
MESKPRRILNHCTRNQNGTIQYSVSDMVLHINLHASYLSEPKARSRVGGHFFLSSNTNSTNHIHNGSILAMSTVYNNALFSVIEAEVAGTFINAKEGVNVRSIIHSMGHPEPRTSLLTNNLTTFGIISGKMKQ